MKSNRDRRKSRHNYADAQGRAETHETGFASGAFKIPEGVELMRFKKAGTYRFDILPYEVKRGKEKPGGNPYAKTGSLHYERTYYVHPRVGPEEKTYCCPRRTFGKACAICEDMAKMRRSPEADEARLDELKVKERQLFNIKDRSAAAEADAKPGLLEFNYWHFGKVLDAMIKADSADPSPEGYKNFFHLENGFTLKVTVVEETVGTGKYYKPSVIEFKSRAGEYDDSILDEVCDLDKLLIEMSSKDLEKAYFQTGEDDEEDDDEELPIKKRGKSDKKSQDDDEDDNDEDDEDREEDDLEDEEDEEDEAPHKRKVKKPTKKPKHRSRDEDWDD